MFNLYIVKHDLFLDRTRACFQLNQQNIFRRVKFLNLNILLKQTIPQSIA